MAKMQCHICGRQVKSKILIDLWLYPNLKTNYKERYILCEPCTKILQKILNGDTRWVPELDKEVNTNEEEQ